MEELIRTGIPGFKGPLRRIPYGIDARDLTPAEKEPKILVAARLFERKGVREVIEALRELRPNGYSLEVAGDGPERRRLEALTRESGVPARFHGWLSRGEMDELFGRCRIFVLATRSDNFPSSLLEAMAAGCAIVTTRAGGCPEVIGDTGLLVDYGDPKQLRESLRVLTADRGLCRDLGARARARALGSFDWNTIAAAHEVVFREAIGRRERLRDGTHTASEKPARR
jgi:glycosyltransferase involved in cell wall biosynthesis